MPSHLLNASDDQLAANCKRHKYGESVYPAHASATKSDVIDSQGDSITWPRPGDWMVRTSHCLVYL